MGSPARRCALAIALAWGVAVPAGPARAAESNDGIEAALLDLRDALSGPPPCDVTPSSRCDRAVALALRGIDGALTALDPAPPRNGRMPRDAKLASNALNKVRSGLMQLERAGLGVGAIGQAIEDLVAAVTARVEDSQAGAEDAIDALCSGQRVSTARRLTAPLKQVDAAALATTAAQRLLKLRIALGGFDSAQLAAEKARARCQPRACKPDGTVVFTPGDPSNPAFELIAADKGTVLDYELVSGELAGIDVSGDIRITYQGLTRFGILAELDIPFFGDVAEVKGSASFNACTDEAGWIRMSNLSERLSIFLRGLRRRAGGSLTVASKPPALSLISTLFPLPPGALVLRVGDRVEQSGLDLMLRLSGEPSLRLTCNLAHEVEAIENVMVGSESVPTARIGSSMGCAEAGSVPTETQYMTTWIASRIGEVRAELQDDGVDIEIALSCYELPATSSAGRCGSF